MSINYMGPDVREAQKDMELLPLPVLFQYMQNPQNMSADGVAFSLIAATELARRKRLEDAATASQQPDPSRVPTIAEGLMSGQMGDMEGVPTPKTGIAAFAQPAPAPAPVAAAPAPVAAAPAPVAAAPASAPMAMASPPVRMAHGGIIAFNGERESLVPEGNSGLEAALLADAERDPQLKDPAYRAAIMQSMKDKAAAGKAFHYRPGATSSGISTIQSLYAAQLPKILEQAAVNRTITPDEIKKVRGAAEEQRLGITSPAMGRIAALQTEAEGIGSRRDEGALGRALMNLGLRTMQGGSRPGTAGYSLAGAGLEALGSYEKEQMGMIERALKINQTKIALENELMKQGLDRNTAANVAEEQARRRVEAEDKETQGIAKNKEFILHRAVSAETAQQQADLREQQEQRLREQSLRQAEYRDRAFQNPRQTDTQREINALVEDFMRQGMSKEEATTAAYRQKTAVRQGPTMVRLEEKVRERVATYLRRDKAYRALTDPAARIVYEERKVKEALDESLKLLAGKPAAPAGSASSAGARRELAPGVYVTERP